MVIVPRHGETAVRRNQLRRRIREIGRRCILPVLAMPVDVGVRARAAAYDATFEVLKGEMVGALCVSSRAC